jgi:hypothetical protein
LTPARTAIVDTTIQIDRQKTGVRRKAIESLLAEYTCVAATSIGLLEFKATLIQECITIHDRLKLIGRFTRARDGLIESTHPQSRLRAHIFNNLVTVFAPSSHDISEEEDAKLADMSRLKLAADIPRLYDWFKASVDRYLDSAIACTRADERPRFKNVAFEVNLPKCRRGLNKNCKVEELFRRRRQFFDDLKQRIDGRDDLTQLQGTVEVYERIVADDAIDVSHSDCRKAGDCLQALEGIEEGATHALSTNARDWETVCGTSDMTFVHVTYPEEKAK